MENLGKRTLTIDRNITNRIQESEDSISGIKDTIEETDPLVKEEANPKQFLTQNTHENSGSIKKNQTNQRIIEIEWGGREGGDSQLKGSENIVNKGTEAIFPNLK